MTAIHSLSAASEEIGAALSELPPQQPIYQNLRAALARNREGAQGDGLGFRTVRLSIWT